MSHGEQSHNHSSQERAGGGDSSKDREKEKKGWFHSLTRRKKSDSALAVSASASSSGSQNNNNEVCVLEAADSSMASCSNGGTSTGTLRRRRDKDKEKRNVFARLRRKVGQGLSSLRNWHSMGDCDDGGTTDATYEFLTPAICPEPTLPFTHDYLRFIRKKWLEREDAHSPNQVMYKACSEMIK